MNRTIILTLTACTAGSFLLTLVIYAALGGNPLARIGYAVFMAIVPAVLTVLTHALFKLSRGGIIAVYVVLFVLVIVLQGEL